MKDGEELQEIAEVSVVIARSRSVLGQNGKDGNFSCVKNAGNWLDFSGRARRRESRSEVRARAPRGRHEGEGGITGKPTLVRIRQGSICPSVKPEDK